MKSVEKLSSSWWIKSYENEGGLIDTTTAAGILKEYHSIQNGWLETDVPKQVQEILIEKGIIDECVLTTGIADSGKWFSCKDWVYRCSFKNSELDGEKYLNFNGLDTTADIYLNGSYLISNNTMFRPLRVNVTGRLKEENNLMLYFHSPHKMIAIYEKTMPEDWKGIIKPGAMLRKSAMGYGDHFGVKPQYVPIGIYGDVCFETVDSTEIIDCDVKIGFNIDRTKAFLKVKAAGVPCTCDTAVKLELFDPDGFLVYESIEAAKECNNEGWQHTANFTVDLPRLWWPKNYGGQPLYRLSISVFASGAIRDEITKTIGFREIKEIGDLKFEVNGKVVRLWGSAIAPVYGPTHRWNPEREAALIDFADKGNMNVLRIWGPNQPYSDRLYEETDKRGIFLWQDFFVAYTQLPDTDEYRDLYKSEAASLIKRLKHHPSILLWCGGNENIFLSEFYGEKTRKGHEILTYDFRQVCLELDHTRHYHDSSPMGGRFANDPMIGDTHGGHCILSFLPGEDYPVFPTENIRSFPHEVKSLKRFIKEDELWPEGYSDRRTYGVKDPLPDSWMYRTTNNMKHKTGPVEQFYDAHDPESLVYRFAAAAGLSLRQAVNRSRQGRPFYESHGERKSTGHLVWKLNDTWPQIYCGLVDYYLEVNIPYYYVKRAFMPFQIAFDVHSHIYLWGVNDTAGDITGSLNIRLFSMARNEVFDEFSVPAVVREGEACIITDLDRFGSFPRDTVMYSSFSDANGHVVARDNEFVNIERNLVFPDAELKLAVNDGFLEIATDQFARCVKLSGNENGDEFGWYFEDNYFDLMPFEKKKVRISGRHKQGTISAKAHYAVKTAKVEYIG